MSSNAGSIFVGVDVGASRTKAAILNRGKSLVGYEIRKSGIDFTRTAEICLEASLEMAGASGEDVVRCVSTGYGRKNVPFSNETKTEI